MERIIIERIIIEQIIVERIIIEQITMERIIMDKIIMQRITTVLCPAPRRAVLPAPAIVSDGPIRASGVAIAGKTAPWSPGGQFSP